MRVCACVHCCRCALLPRASDGHGTNRGHLAITNQTPPPPPPQVVDDVLDLTASSSILGKPALNDLKSGVATAPVLFAAQQHPELCGMIKRKFRGSGDLDRVGGGFGAAWGLLQGAAMCRGVAGAAMCRGAWEGASGASGRVGWREACAGGRAGRWCTRAGGRMCARCGQVQGMEAEEGGGASQGATEWRTALQAMHLINDSTGIQQAQDLAKHHCLMATEMVRA